MAAQSAILAPSAQHARFFMFNLGKLSVEQLQERIGATLAQHTLLQTQHEDTLRVGFAFGTALWKTLYGSLPDAFYDLLPIESTQVMPANPVDVFVHIESSRADLCFALAQTLCEGIDDLIDVVDEQAGFRYMDKRDLTGFIDGTENPSELEERAQTALLPDGEFVDGSFVFAQRYVHHLQDWKKLSVTEQEQVMGRTKLESIELEDDVKPDNAHISRVTIEDEAGEELPILRHSLPYGSGTGDKGLFFLSYSHELSRVDTMLQNMFGQNGVSDHLLKFTTPVNGAYFFAPSCEMLEALLD